MFGFQQWIFQGALLTMIKTTTYKSWDDPPSTTSKWRWNTSMDNPIYKPRIQVMGWSPRTKITHQDSAFIFLFHRLITFALLILSSGCFFWISCKMVCVCVWISWVLWNPWYHWFPLMSPYWILKKWGNIGTLITLPETNSKFALARLSRHPKWKFRRLPTSSIFRWFRC